MSRDVDGETFPCSLTLNVPFPTSRLSSIAMRALAVDKELSPLVQRHFSTATTTTTATTAGPDARDAPGSGRVGHGHGHQLELQTEPEPELEQYHGEKKSLASGHRSPDAAAAAGGCVLRVHYKATTNRMLRVAVNSFMDSLALILEVMERLDVDVLEAQHAG